MQETLNEKELRLVSLQFIEEQNQSLKNEIESLKKQE